MSNENPQKRFNRVVTQALNTSVYSRQVHDDLYGKDKFYTYGMEHVRHNYQENGMFAITRGAYIENILRGGYKCHSVRLILGMHLSDEYLVLATHHELAHIHQIANMQKFKINQTSLNASIHDYAGLTMMQEMHAAVWEQEGALRKHFDNLEQNKLDDVETYKKYAELEKNDFRSYAASLLGDENILQMPVNAAVEHVTFSFYNGFMQQPEEKKQQDFMTARKAMITRFAKGNKARYYAESILNGYEQTASVTHRGMDLSALGLGQEEMDFLGLETRDYCGEVPTIPLVAKAFNEGKEEFLSPSDWQEALQAKDHHEFIDNLMMNLPWHQQYKKLVERNKIDKLI